MKIGEFVKQHIKQIFFYCDNTKHDEINFLLDLGYSKKTFGLSSYPFCKEIEHIEKSESKRYWTEIYLVRGKQVRVTSQWIDKMKPSFINYLHSIGITSEIDSPDNKKLDKQKKAVSDLKNSRYRGNHIGNAQNLFIRNILSNLGIESFNEEDWKSTKDYFLHIVVLKQNC